MAKSKEKSLKVTLIKSLSGRLKDHIACAHGLGLRKIRQTAVVEDTASIRGMIDKISYLLKVEEE